MNVEIGIAKPEDARDMQEVFHRAWLKAYPNAERGITVDDIEDRFKDAYSEETLAKRRGRIANPEQGTTWLVARIDGKAIGLCTIIVKEDRNQLQRIYVHPDYQHQGIGTDLWKEAQKYLNAAKDTYVDVADYNQQAIAFYTKLGFVPAGRTHQEERFRMKSGAIFTEMEMVLRAR